MGISLPFYSLAFVHGYIGGVSLYFNDLVFSLGGAGEMGGWFCGLLGPQREGNEWGEMIFRTTTKKKLFYCKMPIIIWSAEKPSSRRREKATSLLSLSLKHTLCYDTFRI